jgi:hypothetical protein
MINFDGELSPTSYVGTCDSCGAWTRLRAFDAKKILRVGVPIKRVGQVHVEARCDACGAARAIEDVEWQALVAQVRQDAAGAGSVDDEDKAAEILVGLAEIHDRDAFMPVAHPLSERFVDSLVVQRALLFAYDRFDMGIAAERAANQLVAIEDTPENRRALARVYLRQQKPAEAEEQLRGQEGTPEGVGHLTLVAELYALQGASDAAMELLSRLDPDDPVVLETRALIERNLAGGPLLQVRYLPTPDERRVYETPRSAASPGCLWSLLLALGIPVLALIGLAIAFATEDIEFVNGTNVPYVVEVDGERHQIPPGHTTIDLKSGVHDVRAFVGTEREFTFPLKVSSLGTYKRHIVNPDRGAILHYEEAEYKIVPTDHDHYKSEFISGELEYELEADFFWQEFPVEIDMYEDSEIRGRVTLWGPKKNLIFAVDQILLKEGGMDRALDLLRARLLVDPDDALALDELVYRTPVDRKPELRAFLAQGLDATPPRVSWHRAFLKTGFGAKDDYLIRAVPEDPCLKAVRATVETDVEKKAALFAEATEADDACDLALNERALFEARRGDKKVARAMLARAQVEPSARSARDHAHLLVGLGKNVAAEREGTSEAEHRAIRIWTDLLEGRKRQGIRRTNEFLDVVNNPGDTPADVVATYNAWTGFVLDIADIATFNREKLTARAQTDPDMLFALNLIDGKLDDASAGLYDGTPEAHLLVAAHALKQKSKREKKRAAAHVTLAKQKWGSPLADVLTSKKPPSLKQARAAAAELQLPRALFAYLGAKHKKKAKVFYGEADRLLTDLSWSSLAVRAMPYKWRQGRVR